MRFNEGIPPAQNNTPDSFSELEDIVILQEVASVLENNCTPPQPKSRQMKSYMATHDHKKVLFY